MPPFREVEATGPLVGIRVLELGGIGPGPFGAMMLSDLGAEVLRIDPPGAQPLIGGLDPRRDVLLRGRRSVVVDLKHDRGRALALGLLKQADVLIDPYRPGVAERLGLGPDEAMALNERLIYVRMTGWGQTGPWSSAAGHDINYIALAGPLAAMGRAGSPPPPPLNLIGDFGGGGMLLTVGVLAAVVERGRSGAGQVVDAAMVDGSALLFASVAGFQQMDFWQHDRESNVLDGGAPYYDTYETADGGHVAVGAIEPRFYAELLERLGLDLTDWPQDDRERWPALRERLCRVFRSRTRDQWAQELGGTNACFAPVLALEEAATHPQLAGRAVYQRVDGLLQPAPAPRFSRTPGKIQSPPSRPGEHGREALLDWGLSPDEVGSLRSAGVLATPPHE